MALLIEALENLIFTTIVRNHAVTSSAKGCRCLLTHPNSVVPWQEFDTYTVLGIKLSRSWPP